MEIIEEFLRINPRKKEIKLSDIIVQKKAEVVRHMSYLSSDDDDEKTLESYWARILQRLKKQNNIKDRSFIIDRSKVDWVLLNNSIIEEKANIAEKKLLGLANKRRKIHNDLHIQADKAAASLLITSSTGSISDQVGQSGPSTQPPRSTSQEIDDFFQNGPRFSLIELKRDIERWQESAERVDQLHKQDLLYYNILDFVTTRPDAATKMLLSDKYTAFREHMKSFYTPLDNIKDEVDMLIAVDDDYIHKLSNNIVKDLIINDSKEGDICKMTLRLIHKQFKDDQNIFTDQSISEYHFTSAFIFPLFDELFDDISRIVISQKWGEPKLMCAKQNEHNALSDAHRRTPGPSIDGIFTIPIFNSTEFLILEVSGGPAYDDFEHFLGDRNKIAKNLKLMMKNIISQRVNKHFGGLSSVKIYGLQVYKNEIYVYSLTSPIVNRYMFDLDMKFSLPATRCLLSQSFPKFMQNIWKLKRMIVSSCKGVEHFILEEKDNDEDPASDISSPYVSPSKRKENK